MKVIGVIPARYASSRFPGKPLVDIKGKSMIQRVYERSLTVVDELFVATDDERIYNHVKEFGGEVVMTKKSHESGTDRCAEVVELLPHLKDDDVVINVQGDEPLIDPLQIQLLAGLFNDPNTQIGSLVREIAHPKVYQDPNSPKVVLNKEMEAMYFSRSPIPHGRELENSQIPEHCYQHIGIYGYRKASLIEISKLEKGVLEEIEKLEQLRWLEHGYKIKTGISNQFSHSIDTKEDLDELLLQFGNLLT